MVDNKNRLAREKPRWYHVGMELSKRKVGGVLPSRIHSEMIAQIQTSPSKNTIRFPPPIAIRKIY